MSERATGRRGAAAVNWRTTGDGVRLYEEGAADAWVEVTLAADVPPDRQLFAVCPDCGFVAPQRTGPGRGMVCGECGAEAARE